MSRPVAWTDRLEDGVKREIRVTFVGKDAIRWQAHRSDTRAWEYDFLPTEENWARLEDTVAGRYRRRSVPLKCVELIRRLRSGA
jgi:hypothetical protein